MLSESKRLQRIAEIIEDVDNRCLAVDGSVPRTREIITDEELREIYRLAKENARATKLRITATVVFEYEPNPKNYPDCVTYEDMLAVDVEQMNDPIIIADMVAGENYATMTVTGEVVEEDSHGG